MKSGIKRKTTLITLLLALSCLFCGVSATAMTQTETSDSTDNTTTTPSPTFSAELEEETETVGLWFGNNLLAIGNSLTVDQKSQSGLFFALGSNLSLGGKSNYGFLLGAVIDYTGETQQDLFAAGDSITLHNAAKVGQDVFLLGNVVDVEMDVAGDLSIMANELTLKNIEVAGNVNLNVNKLNVEGEVKIGGTLTYNEDATIGGFNQIQSQNISVYEVERQSQAQIILSAFYDKILEIVALFIVIAILIMLAPQLYQQITDASVNKKYGKHLASGIGTLIILPIIIIFTLFAVITTPLSLILLGIYLIIVYLSQGITGVCIGHYLLTKITKRQPNRYLEAIFGITLLGLLSLVPYLGLLTSFIALVFGTGFITNLAFDAYKNRSILALPKKAKK